MRAPVGVDIDAGYDVRAAEVDVPMKAELQECAALPGAQKTMAHAVKYFDWRCPHFMIVEQED